MTDQNLIEAWAVNEAAGTYEDVDEVLDVHAVDCDMNEDCTCSLVHQITAGYVETPSGLARRWDDSQWEVVHVQTERGGQHKRVSEITIARCGTCGRYWDDGYVTALTPVPSGRCPFEHEH
jgi:hypothetical protein